MYQVAQHAEKACHASVQSLWPPYEIGQAIIFLPCGFLWPPFVAGADIILLPCDLFLLLHFMVALWNTADHYIFALWFLLSLFFFLA